MLQLILWITCGALSLFAVYFYSKLRNSESQYKTYKELFELADSESKQMQSKLENLVRAVGEKDVMMERAAQALESSNSKLVEQGTLLSALDEKLKFQEIQYNKLLGQKKSSEVRTGKITEQISPFLADYPLSPDTAHFLGDPIDFIHFEPNRIVFVEVKSGQSKLSKKQREIRDMVKEGKVEFVVYRVKGDPDPEPEEKG